MAYATSPDSVAISQSPNNKRVKTASAPVQRGRMSLPLSLGLLAPLALLLGSVFFWPIFSLLYQSISKPDWTLQHYGRLVSEPLYGRIVLRTMWIAFATTALSLLLAYPIAVLMSRIKGWKLLVVTACVMIPLWTSVLIRSYAWIMLLQRNGIINNWLRDFGLIDRPLTMLYTEGAVLLAMTHVLLPLMILPIYSTLRNISPDFTKAALNLGASQMRAFLTVLLPLSLPGVFAGCLMVFVLALGFYITPMLVGGPQTLMISTLISQQATELLNWPFAGAISFVLLALSIGVTIAFKRLLGVERLVSND